MTVTKRVCYELERIEITKTCYENVRGNQTTVHAKSVSKVKSKVRKQYRENCLRIEPKEMSVTKGRHRKGKHKSSRV